MSGASEMIEESHIPSTLEEVHARLAEMNMQYHSFKDLLQDEEIKHKRYTVKNFFVEDLV